MTKFLIKINSNSIKKNPNVGQKDYLIHNGSTTILKIKNDFQKYLVKKLEEKFDIAISKYEKSIICTYIKNAEFYVPTNINLTELIDFIKLFVKSHNIEIDTKYNIEHVMSMTSEPEYFYEYEDSIVGCCYCGEEFKRSLLIDESYYDDDDYPLDGSLACPFCYEEDCCELEFEKFKS